MKFNCGRTYDERSADKWERYEARKKAAYEWHRVFAWLPVRLGSQDCRWLEYVERRVPPNTATWDYVVGEFYWEYRAAQVQPTYMPY